MGAARAHAASRRAGWRRHRARRGPRRHAQEQVAAQLRDPTFQFSNKVNELVYGACYFFEPFTLSDLHGIDPALACGHFSDAYANPAEFHICLTGAIEVRTGTWGCRCPGVWKPPAREGCVGGSGGLR